MAKARQVPKFTKAFPFLNIYKPKQSLNDSTFHFFSEPQPGYQKVSLHNKQNRKSIPMFYELVQSNDEMEMKAKLKGKQDTSIIIDFQYFSIRNNQEQQIVDRSKVVKESQWVRKYEPDKFIDLLTDDKVNRNMLTWLKSWDPIVFNNPVATKKQNLTPQMFNRTLGSNKMGKMERPVQQNYIQAVFSNPKKLILLAGPPGCGKTTLMRVLAKHCKYEIVQINASDDRSAQTLVQKLQDISGNDTIRGNKKPALICLDQIDGVVQSESNGIIKVLDLLQGSHKQKNETKQHRNTKQKQGNNVELDKAKKQKKMVTESQPNKKDYYSNKITAHNTHLNRPVIFICNDPFAKSLKQLRSRAHVVYFSELNPQRIIKRMRQILQKQKVYIELQVLQKICEICRNDVRSCIGVLELIVRQKRSTNKNPKDIVNKMKLSFAKDNQVSINQFITQLIQNKPQIYQDSQAITTSFAKKLQTKILEINNPTLLVETFFQNINNVHGLGRKFRQFPGLYNDFIFDDILGANAFKYQNQLNRFHLIPYFRFCLKFDSYELPKVQFPSPHFERIRKMKYNKEILRTIFSNIPIQLKIFLRNQTLIGSYLLALYLSMQTSSNKQSDTIKCASVMLSYGFTFKRQRQQNHNYPIFNPEIDILLSYGTRKPQVLVTSTTKALIQENYEYFKDKKQILATNELRDNTIAMVNQMNLHSRKKKAHDLNEGIRYKYSEGTGTKTTYSLSINYFF